MYARKTHDWCNILCCWTLGLIFIYAGTLKLLAPMTFAVLIEAYGIVPEMLLMPVAVALPALEVVAGIGLLLNIRGSLGVITVLLLLFVVMLDYGIRMGLDVDCGCFGPEDPEAEAFHGLRLSLYRDLAMLAGVAFVYAWRRYHNIQPMRITVFINKQLENRSKEDAFV